MGLLKARKYEFLASNWGRVKNCIYDFGSSDLRNPDSDISFHLYIKVKLADLKNTNSDFEI